MASTKNAFEIEAVIPELDAISKYDSGVTSPIPNLPDDMEENLAKVEERELLIYMSFVKVLLSDQVLAVLLEAGPFVQSSRTYDWEVTVVEFTLNIPESKDMELICLVVPSLVISIPLKVAIP